MAPVPKPFPSQLAELDVDTELFPMAERIEALKASPVWEDIQGLLQKARAVAEYDLIDGGKDGEPHSRAQFARLGGYISGLDTIDLIVESVQQAARDARDRIEAEASRQEAIKAEEETPIWTPEPEPATA